MDTFSVAAEKLHTQYMFVAGKGTAVSANLLNMLNRGSICNTASDVRCLLSRQKHIHSRCGRIVVVLAFLIFNPLVSIPATEETVVDCNVHGFFRGGGRMGEITYGKLYAVLHPFYRFRVQGVGL